MTRGLLLKQISKTTLRKLSCVELTNTGYVLPVAMVSSKDSPRNSLDWEVYIVQCVYFLPAQNRTKIFAGFLMSPLQIQIFLLTFFTLFVIEVFFTVIFKITKITDTKIWNQNQAIATLLLGISV